MKIYISFVLLLAILSSCSDFLNVPPSKNQNVEIKTLEQLDALLGNYNIFFEEASRAYSSSTYDADIPVHLYEKEKITFTPTRVFHFFTYPEGIKTDNREDFWSREYKKIFYANTVLANLPKVSGDQKLKDRLDKEAHFIRAISYFQLLNTYSMLNIPENKDKPGITLRTNTSFEETAARATIEESYKALEADLNIALEENSSLIKDGRYKPYRISKAGVTAFAARYYNHEGNYDKALEYAQKALDIYSELVDYNTEMSYDDKPINVTANGVEHEILVPKTYRATNADIINWKEFYYVRALYSAYGWYIPSQNLMDLYDQANDLRYRYHFAEGFSYFRQSKEVSYPGYLFFTSYHIPSGPTVPEMLLIKAESLIRKGQWQEGMKSIETLRVKRIESQNYAPLVANNQQEAFKILLEERRREMPFAHGWLDARRLNQNSDPSDDVAIRKNFFPINGLTIETGKPVQEYVIEGNSPKWAYPIPLEDIKSSNNVIIQNEY